MNKKFNIKARKKARQLALQALYQWMVSGADLYEIEAQFCTDNDMSKVDLEYFNELLYQIPKLLNELDSGYQAFLDRPVAELNPVECIILRIGAYELMQRLEIPYRVVLNEAIEMTKRFGAEDGHKYVNGVLDKLAQKVRSVELKAQ